MFKLFRKKSKKGFTLAELLVVVAIIAILVAIAIPIFTGALQDAQWRVNQANIRSVKAAGVTEILTNWKDHNKTDDDDLASSWIITATVDQNGAILTVPVNVKALADTSPDETDGIAVGAKEEPDDWDDIDFIGTSSPEFKTTATGGTNVYYYVRAVVTDLSTKETS